MLSVMRLKSLFAVRDVDDLIAETHEEGESLRKTIGAFGLTAMGVGAIIGTGIFVVIGQGVALAGPSLVLAFILAAITCLFSALSYAELASAVPVSGSAYTFSYATMGEMVAFIIGWDLILEYGVSVAAVAVGWGGNVNEFLLAAFGYELPAAISTSPSDGGVFNLPAVFIVLAITVLLVRGTKESAGANAVMVVIKIIILLFFIIVAFTAFNGDHFVPFAPNGAQGDHHGGRGDLLRLHRLRRRHDRLGGVQESEPGPADRHRRLAGDLDRALRAGGHRRDRGRPGGDARGQRRAVGRCAARRARACRGPVASWPLAR